MSDDKANANAEGQAAKAGETNPLLPDLQKWKDAARTAQDALKARDDADAEQARQAAIAQATTAEEIETLKAAHKAEMARDRRALEIQRDAAQQGIDGHFIKDDGTSTTEEILAQAKASMDTYNATVLEGTKTTPIGGGATPSGAGAKRTFTQAEINDPVFYKKHREEIVQAMYENRIEKPTGKKE
jgi:hypothetical protein